MPARFLYAEITAMVTIISLTDEKIAIYSERFAEPEYYTDEDLQDAIFCEIKSYNNLDDLLNDFMGNKEDEEDMEL